MISSAYIDFGESGAFQLHDHANCFLSSFELGTPPPRAVASDRPHRHGSFDVTSYFGPRTIQIAGELQADSAATLWSTREGLITALSLEAAHVLTFTREGLGYSERATVRIGSQLTMPVGDGGALYLPWSITLVAPDPRLYKSTATTATSVSPNTTETVANAGTVRTPAVLELTGPIDTGSTIENTTTGQTITLAKAVPAATTITVDTGARTVKDAGGALDMSYIDASATEWWELDPGNNDLEWNGTGDTGATEYDVTIYDARI